MTAAPSAAPTRTSSPTSAAPSSRKRCPRAARSRTPSARPTRSSPNGNARTSPGRSARCHRSTARPPSTPSSPAGGPRKSVSSLGRAYCKGRHMPRHESVWSATAPMPECAALQENVHVDVCVIGGGITGLSTAYHVCKAGRSVAVLDDGPLASGMTRMTTGHLTNMLDDRYFELEKLHGAEAIRVAADSHTAAIERIDAIVRAEGIDCDFARLDGYLFLDDGDKPATLDRELDAAHRAGLAGVELMARAPYDWDTGPCLRFPQQGQFHPLKYLAGLAQAIRQNGGRIFCHSHADHVEGGVPGLVHVGRHVVTADAVVVATNVPINNLLAIHTKQAPYMTYVIGARVPAGAVPKALAWDTGDPYHYIRLHDDLLIVGGEDHKSGQAYDSPQRYRRLDAWARARFPMMGELEYMWGGQVMEPVDYLAFIGHNPLDRSEERRVGKECRSRW